MCTVVTIFTSLSKLVLLEPASCYVHRDPSWSRGTCNSFLWISSVVKLLKHMRHHLLHSKCVCFLICMWLCCLFNINITVFVLYTTPEQNISHYLPNHLRFQVMSIHQFLYLLQQKVLMLARQHQSCILSNLVPSQVLVFLYI